MKIKSTLVVASVLAVLLAGCGSGDDSPPSGEGPVSTPVATEASGEVVVHTVKVDGLDRGMAEDEVQVPQVITWCEGSLLFAVVPNYDNGYAGFGGSVSVTKGGCENGAQVP